MYASSQIMSVRNPDLTWYMRISQEKGVSPRCPYASVHRCPRYYQSISLLGECGTTKIDQAEDKALLKKWENSDLWPVIREQATSIFGPEKDTMMFNRFCPEASFDRFGWFASDLYRYADDIDRNVAHAELNRQGARGEDWRWAWSAIHEMHYTECPLYSLLLYPMQNITDKPKREGILDVRPGIFGVRLNLNPIVSCVREWLRRKRTSR